MGAPFWIGVTDRDWFDFLRARRPDEVNFWSPSGKQQFRALEPGGLFLFKLHSPDNYVAGGGYFVRYTALPVRLAWEAFGEKNGVDSLIAFQERIAKYRKEKGLHNPVVGCNILIQPFFFDEPDWIPVPRSWAPNIVRGKRYYVEDEEGAELLQQVSTRLHQMGLPALDRDILEPEQQDRYGEPYLARARLGQGAFRVLVTDAYNRRCAATGERTLPTLEAAHIKPYAENGPHRIANGLLLRSDWHRLFDEGYVTVTPDHRIEVSERIREEFENGREYYRHHGQRLIVEPHEPWQRPGQEFIEWHNTNVYRG